VVISNPAPSYFAGAAAVTRRAGFENPLTSGYAIYAYAAVQVFAQLARETRSNFSGAALVAAARRQPVATAIGQLPFDERGEIKNWHFAAYARSADPDVCKSPKCKDYKQCEPCSK